MGGLFLLLFNWRGHSIQPPSSSESIDMLQLYTYRTTEQRRLQCVTYVSGDFFEMLTESIAHVCFLQDRLPYLVLIIECQRAQAHNELKTNKKNVYLNSLKNSKGAQRIPKGA